MTPQELATRIFNLENWQKYIEGASRYIFTKDIYIRNNRRIIGSIYGGEVNGGGTAINLPAGWTSGRDSTGNYTITHNLGTTDYVVTTAPFMTGSTRYYVVDVSARAANSFSLNTIRSSGGVGSNKDIDFFFILMLV